MTPFPGARRARSSPERSAPGWSAVPPVPYPGGPVTLRRSGGAAVNVVLIVAVVALKYLLPLLLIPFPFFAGWGQFHTRQR